MNSASPMPYQNDTGMPRKGCSAILLNSSSWNDTTFEADELFYVRLLNPVDATIPGGDGVGTILNDDPTHGGR